MYKLAVISSIVAVTIGDQVRYHVHWENDTPAVPHPDQPHTYISKMNDQLFVFDTKDCDFHQTPVGWKFEPKNNHCEVTFRDHAAKTKVHAFINPNTGDHLGYSESKNERDQIVMCGTSMVIQGCHSRCGDQPFKPHGFPHCANTPHPSKPPSTGSVGEPKVPFHPNQVTIRDGSVYQVSKWVKDNGKNHVHLHPLKKYNEKYAKSGADLDTVFRDEDVIGILEQRIRQTTKREAYTAHMINLKLHAAHTGLNKIRTKLVELQHTEMEHILTLAHLSEQLQKHIRTEWITEREVAKTLHELNVDTEHVKHDRITVGEGFEPHTAKQL